MYSTGYCCVILMKFEIFSPDFRNSLKYQISWKSARFLADGQTDRRDEANSRFSQYLRTRLKTSQLTAVRTQSSTSRWTEPEVCITSIPKHSLPSDLTLYTLTYLLTPRSWVLLEKLNDLQLVKKFPALYGTRKFITVFTIARHLSLSWANSIQPPPPPFPEDPSTLYSHNSIFSLSAEVCREVPTTVYTLKVWPCKPVLHYHVLQSPVFKEIVVLTCFVTRGSCENFVGVLVICVLVFTVFW